MKKILKTKRGFTLIELLVVIGIIGILSTIGAVSFGSARAKARDAKRQGDLRALQSALEIDAANDPLGQYEAVVAAGATAWITWLANMNQSGTILPPGGAASTTDTYCYYTDTARTKYVLVAEGVENLTAVTGGYIGTIAAGLGAGPVIGAGTHADQAANCQPIINACGADCDGAGGAGTTFCYCLKGGS